MIAAQAAVARKDMSSVTSTRNFLRSLGGTIALALAATIMCVPLIHDVSVPSLNQAIVHSNNILQSELGALSFSQELITAIINDPTGIYQASSIVGSSLLDLDQSIKDQIVQAYVDGFKVVFRVYIGLIGTNLYVLHSTSLNEHARETDHRRWHGSLCSIFFIKRLNLSREGEAELKEKGKAWIKRRGHKDEEQAVVEKSIDADGKVVEKP